VLFAFKSYHFDFVNADFYIAWQHEVVEHGPYMNISIYSYCYTWCDNLIPGIVAAYHWGVESGKLVYSSVFRHVPTCVYMSHRQNESFVPEEQRK